MAIDFKPQIEREPELAPEINRSSPAERNTRVFFSNPRLQITFALLVTLTLAMLAGYFTYGARYNEDFRFYPFNWKAHWITTPYRHTQLVCFRKDFNVDGDVNGGYLSLASDNYFWVEINGHALHTFYYPNLAGVLSASPTSYNSVGRTRLTNLAHLFEIGRYLQPGPNVITCLVEKDGSNPGLLVQGGYRTASGMHSLNTDSSWQCSPVAQMHNYNDWNATDFHPDNWLYAVDAGPVSSQSPVLADGPVAPLMDPAKASFITDGVANVQTIHFRKTITLPGRVKDGWFRIACSRSFSIAINGTLVGGTAVTDRYFTNTVGRQGFFDSMARLQYKAQYPAYILLQREGRFNVYLLKDYMHAGVNTFDITLQSDNPFNAPLAPRFYCDGKFQCENSSQPVTIASDASWLTSVASGPWSNSQVAGRAGYAFKRTSQMEIAGKIAPGGATYLQTAREDLEILVALGALGYLIAGAILWLRPRLSMTVPAIVGSIYLMPTLVLSAFFLLQAALVASPQAGLTGGTWFANLSLIAGGVAVIAGVAALLIAPVDNWNSLGALRRQNILTNDDAASAPGDHALATAGFWSKYGYALAMGALLVFAGYFYLRGIGINPPLPDEYVSVLATRGILKTGLPTFPNNIVYTRSSLFHYLLAGFALLTGGQVTITNARIFATLWQMLTLPLVYLFGRELKDRKTGLAAAVLVAFSPALLFVVREARFYTQFTFFTTLCFYYLAKSIRNPLEQKYRVYIAFAYVGAYLAQQFSITIFVTIIAVVLVAKQMRYWLTLRSLALIGFDVLVMALDLAWYLKKSVTTLPFVDSDSALQLAVHTDYLEMLPSMLLLNNERSHIGIGILFALGLAWVAARFFIHKRQGPHAVVDGWDWWNYTYLTTAIFIAVTTLVASRPASRYIINALPLAALCAAGTAVSIGEWLGKFIQVNSGSRTLSRLLVAVYAATVITVCAFAYRPLRVWNNETRISNRDYRSLSQYLVEHEQPGDKVIYFNPEVAMVEVGRCDYMFRPRHSSIFKYFGKDGTLRERNSGAIVLDNNDKLTYAMANNQRVWLVINDGVLGTPSNDYNTTMTNTVRSNFKEIKTSFNAELLLWDKSAGHYQDVERAYGYDALGD